MRSRQCCQDPPGSLARHETKQCPQCVFGFYSFVAQYCAACVMLVGNETKRLCPKVMDILQHARCSLRGAARLPDFLFCSRYVFAWVSAALLDAAAKPCAWATLQSLVLMCLLAFLRMGFPVDVSSSLSEGLHSKTVCFPFWAVPYVCHLRRDQTMLLLAGISAPTCP